MTFSTKVSSIGFAALTLSVPACGLQFSPDYYLDSCVEIVADDVGTYLDPTDAFPGEPFTANWREYYYAPSGHSTGAPFDEVEEVLSLIDPATGDVVMSTTRTAPKPAQGAAFAGGTYRSFDFTEFQSDPSFLIQDYLLHVDVHSLPGSTVECEPNEEFDPTTDIALLLPCSCDGYFSYGLRVEGAETKPATPISAGSDIELTWTNVFDGVACAGASALSSGPFQATVSVTGASGDHGPAAFDVASLTVGSATTQTILLNDVMGSTRAEGIYEVTVALDPAGAVAPCTSQGTPDTSGQVAVLTFEITP